MYVLGSIPEWVEGSYLRVGPGVFEIEDFTVNHWFDGFAVLDKFDISKGNVSVKLNRFSHPKVRIHKHIGLCFLI